MSFVSPVSASVTGVFAKTVNTSARPPLEIQILEPLRTKCFPSGESSARERIEPASLPELGSVRANAAMSSPVMRRGRYLCFCSSLPDTKHCQVSYYSAYRIIVMIIA